jgi:hypothetical protein
MPSIDPPTPKQAGGRQLPQRLRREPGQTAVDEQRLRAAVAENMGDLGWLQMAADRRVIEAGTLRGPGGDEERRAVRRENADDVSVHKPAAAQRRSCRARACVELAIAHGFVADDDGRLVGIVAGLGERIHGGSGIQKGGLVDADDGETVE